MSTGANVDTERDRAMGSGSGSGEEARVRGRLVCRDGGSELGSRFFTLNSCGWGFGTCTGGGERDFLLGFVEGPEG